MGAMVANTNGSADVVVTAFVGFCFGKMHDFMAAQQAAQDAEDTTGWDRAQTGVAARNGARKSAIKRSKPIVSRPNTQLL